MIFLCEALTSIKSSQAAKADVACLLGKGLAEALRRSSAALEVRRYVVFEDCQELTLVD